MMGPGTHTTGGRAERDGLAGRRVLVTGGAGFIGAHLVRALLAHGASVTVVDDLSSPSSAGVPDSATLATVRLPDPGFPSILAEGRFDLVFHLAGASYVPPSVDDPLSDLRNNTEVTLHVLEGLRRFSPGSRLVYTSSAAVYGSPQKLPIAEDDPPAPVSPYGVSKLAAEAYVSLYARLHGLHTASLRLFSVYGPGQRKQVVYDLMGKLMADPHRLEVHGTGLESRDFLHVEDVVDAALLVMTSGQLTGEVYNVASGESLDIQTLVEAIAETLQVRPKVQFTGRLRPGDARVWVADIGRLRSLGFSPSVGLRKGLTTVLEWIGAWPPDDEGMAGRSPKR